MSEPIITRGPKGQIYNWPCYRFGPDGERKLFERPEDVPAGFARSPGGVPDTPAPKAAAPVAKAPKRRKRSTKA